MGNDGCKQLTCVQFSGDLQTHLSQGVKLSQLPSLELLCLFFRRDVLCAADQLNNTPPFFCAYRARNDVQPAQIGFASHKARF